MIVDIRAAIIEGLLSEQYLLRQGKELQATAKAFALMELLLLDATRSLNEAQRFRSHVIASTLAENGAEIAALNMVSSSGASADAQNSQGKMSGKLNRSGNTFELTGQGASSGVPPMESSVLLEGTVEGTKVSIVWSRHSQ